MRRRGIFAATAALALAGCAFPQQLTQVAVDHNRMVAQSTDEQTLLNIIRASHRFPLHFTAISTVEGEITLSTAGKLTTSLDPIINPTGSEISATLSTRPKFTANVLSSESFQRGIQSPLPPSLMAYFLSEGWRDSILMALMIERVEFTGPNNQTIRQPIYNNGDAGSEFHRLMCTYELRIRPSAAAPSVPVAAGADSVAAKGATPRPPAVVALVARQTPLCEGMTLDAQAIEKARISIRSTLGVFYFIGEYSRLMENETAYHIPSCRAPCNPQNPVLESRPLINIQRGNGSALLATEFAGERYFIGLEELNYQSGNAPRSMQVITFVEQLVNLNKASAELPSVFTVD